MGLFNKKDSIPKLPSASELPELPKINIQPTNDLPELPSFPSSPKNESINQEMVKSAVNDPISEEPNTSGIPKIPTVNEELEDNSEAKSFETPAPLSFPTPTPTKEPIPVKVTPTIEPQVSKTNDPIFVRIDKFQESQTDFNDIKEKVSEIESVLQKIKEVKLREDEELKGWTEDVEKIKLKLSEIDTDIFSQI